mmetsp:Transcript_27500/g.81494  ORF Transcript_27500/g.81494 Transcript_27500/m.81494 type:complete len:332 (-) Transcript_27500:837-1832(-)
MVGWCCSSQPPLPVPAFVFPALAVPARCAAGQTSRGAARRGTPRRGPPPAPAPAVARRPGHPGSPVRVVVVQHLGEDEAAHVGLRQLLRVEFKLGSQARWRMFHDRRQPFKVGHRERVSCRQPLRRVERQQAPQKLQRTVVCAREACREVCARLGGHRGQERGRLWVCDAGERRSRRRAHQVGDEAQLRHGVGAREERRLLQHLAEHAPQAPHVNGRGVGAVEAAAELGGAVPARRHVVRPSARSLTGRCEPRQTQVAQLELAVGVDEHVFGLDVPVQHAVRVHVRHAAQQLVHDDLVVAGCEVWVGAHDGVQVAVHELKHNVQVAERARV